MEFALHALSPLDGRYARTTQPLSPYFSEFGLIAYRVRVEVEYFIALAELPLPALAGISEEQKDALRALYAEFSEADALEIKRIEKTTNHDVKAVEYFLKDQMTRLGLAEQSEYIHFGLTSQDINNTAIPLSIKEYHEEIFLPALEDLLDTLRDQANAWAHLPMLARTHGQPASPTRLGKEWEVFIVRLEQQRNLLNSIPFAAKFGGATGAFNAHFAAFPNTDWHAFASQFCHETLGLKRSFPTTQIEHYDYLAAYLDGMKRIHTILMDLAKDVWQYISMEYFKQRIVAGEVGSSAMPHKVNPIDFENAEGNLGIANALLEHLAAKLPISRLQRDLTDSTVLRNVGVPFGHSLLAMQNLQKGLHKLIVNEHAMDADLESNWAVVAEGIQTILRRESYPQPYEALKALTRTNEGITQRTISAFIEDLAVSDAVKEELRALRPQTYTGR
ncbi:MAG: adenylosuccinate lyase [Bacteroidetes bacterium]|jgi:adenylosuccinate lyase|nr:adenylosuccinate lyase [Cryomorphaceae bacterium]MDA0362846.1 adenylosuccinate lyase [Bacteroidota bacterium]MDA0829099.1 adenylosuccinate lyase [Bacteroidota bacterium]MDA1198737.1 adenylosuccinate lyase [Bacteroidota bacterium]